MMRVTLEYQKGDLSLLGMLINRNEWVMEIEWEGPKSNASESLENWRVENATGV